jgi:hypothetical protein
MLTYVHAHPGVHLPSGRVIILNYGLLLEAKTRRKTKKRQSEEKANAEQWSNVE